MAVSAELMLCHSPLFVLLRDDQPPGRRLVQIPLGHCVLTPRPSFLPPNNNGRASGHTVIPLGCCVLITPPRPPPLPIG